MSQVLESAESSGYSELFYAILHNVSAFLGVLFVTVILAAYYAFEMATPEFEAVSRFELSNDAGSDFSFGEFSGVASLAGLALPGGASEADKLRDRILSRPFIDRLFERGAFENDPVFNAYIAAPSLQTRLKWLVRGAPPPYTPSREDVVVSTIMVLSERMLLFEADNGVVRLSVFHPDPERAALLANLFVEQSIEDIFDRKRLETRDSLNYFADELLRIRDDLDAANRAVSNYAVTNDIMSASDFAQTSSQLAQVRSNLLRISGYMDTLAALNSSDETEFSGLRLVKQHPVSMDLEFRRGFGWSVHPETWVKPTRSEIDRMMSFFSDRKVSAERNFATLEEQAKILGEQALVLADLEREVYVQQAIYESVITQFEARSLLSGFERASGNIIETAIPPKNPTSPKKSLILLLSIVVGVFLGSIAAVSLSLRKGTLHSLSTIRDSFSQSILALRVALRKVPLNDKPLSTKQVDALKNVVAFIPSEATSISTISTGPRSKGADFSIGIAKLLSSNGDRVALLDIGSKLPVPKDKSWKTLPGGQYKSLQISEKFNVVRVLDELSFLQKSKSERNFEDLKDAFSKVILLVDDRDPPLSILRFAMSDFSSVFIVARRNKVTKNWASEVQRASTEFAKTDPMLVLCKER
jgi:uncharacterized protein involved in exopolysaccharide biosynthesis